MSVRPGRPLAAGQPRPAAAPITAPQLIYLAREAVLFLVLSYVLLLGGTFNGLVFYRLNLTTTVLLGGLAGVYLSWHWLGRRRWPATALDLPLAALLAAYALATALSDDPRRSVGALVLLALYVLIFYVIVDLLRAGWPAELFIKVLLFVSGFIILAGVWELYSWYAGWLAFAAPGQWLPPATIRIRAFLGHPNFVAAFFALLLPLGLAGLRRTRSRLSRLLLTGWSGLTLLLVFFTSSRAGWLGCLVSVGVVAALLVLEGRGVLRAAWHALRRRRGLSLLLAGLLVVVAVAAVAALARQLQHPSHGDRLSIWRVAWSMLAAGPLTGHGPFTFGTEFIRAYSVPPGLLLAHAHNYAFNTLAETGFIGGLALAWVVAALLRTGWRRWRAADGSERLLLAGPLAALCGTAVNSLFDTPQTMPALTVIMVVLAALVSAGGPGAATARAWPKWLLSAGWLVVLGGLVWALQAYGPFSRGVQAFNLGQWSASALALDTATRRDPGLAHYWLQAGYVHGRLALADDGTPRDDAHLAQALAAYERGVRLEPAYATNWANLGLLAWAAGDPGGALAALQTAANRAPGQPAFRLTLGRLHEASGQDDQAQAAYAAVLAARPDWSQAYFFRATPLRRSVVAAAGLLDGVRPDPASGWAALAAGDFVQAHARFAAAAGLNTPDPYLGQGLTYLAEGRLPEAEYALLTARYVSDGQALLNVRTAFALGRLRVAQGRSDEALAEYRRGADILANVTSFGLGTLGTSEYAWYVFNRESVAADLLPGLDYIIYTDDLTPSLVELSDLYRRIGDHTAAARLDCVLTRAVPDDPVLQARPVDGVTCP